NNTITGNSNGIYVNAGGGVAPAIDGNTITGNTNWGIYYTGAVAAPAISGNTITGNMTSLFIPASSLPDETNVLTPNTRNYIGIRGNNIQTDKHLRVWDKGSPNEINTYLLDSGDITVPAFKFLTIDPGVVVKFASNTGIVVDGAMIANGTTAEKIVFTSYRDDIYGGDTNSDGGNTIPLNGDWRGVTFNDSFFEASSRVNNVRIRYAGGNGSGALYFYQANVPAENNEISNSSTNGIRIYSASPAITGNTIWGNSGDGIRVEQGSYPAITFNSISTNLSDGIEVINSSNPTVTNNQIFMNRGYGLLNGTANMIDATQNWWGDPDGSGPYHSSTNTTGKGDRVSNNVAYSPFQTTVATEFSYRNFSAGAGSTGGSMTIPALTQGTLSDMWDPTTLRPDRTMAWDSNVVILDYTGLNSSKRYKLRTSYFYGDAGEVSVQSLTDGNGNPVHGSMKMPTAAPVQYEFSIPSSYYATGNITLEFVHDNPTTTLRAAVTEAWLMEDIIELSPPRFEAVEYNDSDGSGTLTTGDDFYFHFSEEMDTSLLVDGSADAGANVRLVSSGDRVYGTVNQSRWSADGRTAIVTLTDGFTVTGTELITPNGLKDLFGNPSVGTQSLNTTDTIAPKFMSLNWIDQDASGSLSLGDKYVFLFSEAMKTSVIQDGTQNANVYLRPSGGFRYGDVNTINWSSDRRELTVTVTAGFTIHGDELIVPAVFVTDVAGNTVTGSHFLSGKDSTPPVLVNIVFDDADGSGTVTTGDRYFFRFNEPMKTSALSDNTVEANVNLPPAGRKYGNINRIVWNNDLTEASVEITSGFTITGTEVVDPTDLVTDKAGNPVGNTGVLNLVDVIAPKVSKVKAFYISPVSATNNYRLTIQFNSSMDTTAEPLALLTSTGGINPVIPAGGTWMTTLYPNDTYSTPDIVLSQGMDGIISLSVSGARDWAGNTMLPAVNIFSFILDATPPNNPNVSVTSVGCSSATLSWVGYSAPFDLAGFKLYRSTAGSFTTVTGLSFTDLIAPSARSFVVSQLSPGTDYHVAVTAMDAVGNFIPAVVSHPITINRPVPPPVAIAVGSGADPDQSVLSWTGYNTGTLCGFSGFRVYMAETDFTTVTGLTPLATLDSSVSQYTVSGLDRARTYYFAVVGFNSANEFNDAVTTISWSDPYAGDITSDMTIGGGVLKEVMISQTMVIKNNAVVTIAQGTTLRFADGAGITVEAGKLVADGTALKPITLTSDNDIPAGTPNPGDWNGITLSGGDTGSLLRHVFIKYGYGLRLNSSAPTVDAFTALNNNGAGLHLSSGAFLNTSDALLRYNDIGILVETGAGLTITNSVIKNNTINASSDNSQTINAVGNWWGSADSAIIGSRITGSVTFAPFLTFEPVLTPAMATASGETRVGVRDVSLILAGRNAEEMRLSEDSAFTGVFFDLFSPNAIFTLSETGGDKTIFAQLKSPTGTVSTPVSIPVTYVTEGPVINIFSLAEGQVIGRPLTVTAGATAVLGVDVIRFYADDILISSSTGTAFTHLWDVRTLTDGIHRVKLLVRDLAGHVTTVEKNVTVNLVPPPAPVITAPANGLIVTTGPVTVRGTAEPFIPVTVRRNGFVVGTPVAGSNSLFEITNIALQEGASKFVATASDSVGVSTNSNVVTVVLDSGAPAAPVLLSATAIPGNGVDLAWKFADNGEHPSKFRVYRRASAFTDASQATLAANNVTTMLYRDRSLADGTWFYALTGVDDAGNTSQLSNIISVTYDSTAPTLAVSYGSVPPVGAGLLALTVISNEALVTAPGLTITPAGAGSPITVGLTRVDELTYTGSLNVTGATPSGTASVFASARDQAGNAFSGSPSGLQLVIDTRGPSGPVSTSPVEPVQVLNNVNVAVTLSLNESVRVNTIPELIFTPPAGSPVNIAMIGSGSSWSGTLPLNPDMGSGLGQFALSAEDRLGNVGTIITAGGSLEIYNTATPEATEAPGNLAAVSWPAGEVRLSWGAVSKAESYRVYRGSAPCDTIPTEIVDMNLTGTSYTDIPPVDGAYCYGVTTDRRGAESVMSLPVQALSDRLAPDMPENVAVNLGTAGVRVTWGSPLSGELPAKYFVYRNGTRIRTVSAGGAGSFEATDYPATGGSYNYVVASADVIGNENPAAPVIFNLTVGAVSSLQVFINNSNAPILAWTSSDPTAVGYNVYRGGIKLNSALLTTPSFTDIFYAGASRVEYAVRAVNAGGEESPPRKIEVYPIVISAMANPDVNGNPRPLITGYFSKFEVSVQNREAVNSFPMNHLGLRLTVNGTETYSHEQDINQIIAANTTYVNNIIVPIGSSTDDHILRITTRQTGEAGSTVVYQRDVVFSGVQNPPAMITMTVDQVPLAGGLSMVNVCVRNPGYTDMDVVVNRANGTEPGDIYVAIMNGEGLEISRGTYKGYPPGTRISSGTGYVTIPSGGSLCVDVQVLVPANLEEGAIITFTGVVDKFSYQLTGAALNGTVQLTGTMQSGITLSEYYGTAQADSDAYSNNDVINISGQAIDRSTGDPKPDTPLKIGFYLRGFKWFVDITTDSAGNYSYQYHPTPGISGEFIIWAAHPDVYDTIDQYRFSLFRVYISPVQASIRSSKADTFNFNVSLYNPGDTPLTGFSSQFRAYTIDAFGNEIDEPTIQGQANLPSGYQVQPGEKKNVSLQLSADMDAPSAANVEYMLSSAQGASVVFYGSVTLAPAVPVITLESPAAGYVQVSAARGTVRTIPVTVRNNGLRELLDAEMSVPQDVTWISTNLPRSGSGKVLLGTIGVGEARTFDVVITPPSDTAFGDHSDKFVITGSNSTQQTNVNVYVLVTSQLKGSALFRIYNNLGQRVEGATVRTFNNVIHEQIVSPDTDINGEIQLDGLNPGDWSYQVNAPGHSYVNGVITVVADQLILEEAELNRNLITVTFNVVPVPFTDKYELKIEQRFETHVPVPVLVIDPPYVQLANITPGFETTFIVKVSNFGLKGLDNVILETADTGTARLEPLISFMPRLGAMETVEVPYHITYRGNVNALPPGPIGDCAEGLVPGIDFGGLTDAVQGIGAIVRGSTNSYISQAEREAMGRLAVGLLVGIHAANFAQNAAGLGKPVEFLASSAAQFAGCLIGSVISSAPGPGGTPPPPYPSQPNYLTGNGGQGCFAAGTPILMADGGVQKIEEIRAGDKVMTYDGHAGVVKEVYVRESDHILELRYRRQNSEGTSLISRLETTDEHFFWVKGDDKWVAGRLLKSGDLLVLPDGEDAEIVEIIRTEQPSVVYNFDVDEYESYFANGVLAHQKCGGEEETGIEKKVREYLSSDGEGR
ncbi:MAG: right-handed parallel beta-helix repeat-containing protein, partial [Nitrospirae bacterium]|nr:right-handed parallel beta-helix repeat-containing protein [Nitrospirota bacterium]